ncbi:hypothetical protein Glove_168g30 [Diversispora epigaea]|uniref:BTB domain-containing protein n=1 Tax=Diversispora epigaea TaxID=1348612 RepID=A0A397IW61_9GLOM|nr:hypothetical protein Glove_168g30 [Diversispora epigaea]
MSLKFFDKLSQNLIELLNDKNDYNVIIEVENNEKSFTAHSNVLKFRSSYFRRELEKENIQPNENNIKTIIKSNISTQIFNVILQYIYGGIVDLENCETRFIFDLMLAADEFELEELTNKLETLLIETKGSWLRTHFSFIYHFIFSRNDFKKLKNFCNDIIVKYPSLIFDSSDFTSFEESAIVSLLERDDLQIEEIKIWDYVIKWGIARNPDLPTDVEEWTNENFFSLKTSLQQCLPHILKSVILPPRTTLITELPPRAKEPFSTIISEEHAAEISAWIDRETSNYATTNIPYDFQLILLGTRDGFAPQTFWNICNGHSNTVVIVRVKGTDEIIGGYNPLAWDNTHLDDKWMGTKDSFIFSLKNGNIQNSILSRVKDINFAILNIRKNDQNKYGPYFGDFRMYSDKSNFTLDYGCFCRKSGYYYEKKLRSSLSEKFSIINYEVFKLVRKTI